MRWTGPDCFMIDGMKKTGCKAESWKSGVMSSTIRAKFDAILREGGEKDEVEKKIQSLFRKEALLVHPDKQQPQASNEAPSPKDIPSFADLVAARDDALARLARGEGDADREEIGKMASEFMWKMGEMALQMVDASPIDITLEVDLEDVYHARVKKLVVGVLRADAPTPFERQSKTFYVPLIPRGRDGVLDDVIFKGEGDDPIADILLGGRIRTSWSRSDVRVKLQVRPHPVFVRDPVLHACDLHASVQVTLEQHYRGARFSLPHPSGKEVVAKYHGMASGSSKRKVGSLKQVRFLRGKGLPYRQEDATTTTTTTSDATVLSRGDAYVFMEVVLPRLQATDLEDDHVIEALRLLSSFPVDAATPVPTS